MKTLSIQNENKPQSSLPAWFCDVAPVAMAVLDSQLRYIAFTNRWNSELADTIIGAPQCGLEILFAAKELQAACRNSLEFRSARQVQTPDLFSEQKRRKEGQIHLDFIPWNDPDGEFAGLLLYASFHSYSQAEQHNSLVLRTILNVLPQRVFWKDLEGRYQGCNQLFLDDCQLDSVIGRTDYEMPWGKEQGELYRSYDRRIVETNTPELHILEPQTHADLSTIWVSTCKMPLRDEHGQVYGVLGTYMDVTESKVAIDALKQSKEQMNSVYNALIEGVVVTDLASGIIGCNTTALQILELEESQLLGAMAICDVRDSYFEDGSKVSYQSSPTCTTLSKDSGIRNKKISLRFPDGRIKWLSVNTQPVRDETGKTNLVVSSLFDITEMRKAADAVEEARQKAENANKSKSQFLANMSHEIRTPMNGIIGMTELALATKLTDEQRECLDVIRNSSHALLSILNDILDLSKIEAGKLEIRSAPTSLRDLVEGIYKLFSARANSQRLSLVCEVGSCIPQLVSSDDLRVRQVLSNLIGNSLKFTEAGGRVEIKVRLKPGADEGDAKKNLRIVCSVKDSGIGIAADQLEKLFEPFTQVDSSNTRKYGGTGLGLSISRHLAQQMGGDLFVQSMPGVGTTMTFEFDAESCPQPAEKKLPLSAPAISPQKGRVLVAEDNIVNQMVIQKFLEKLGLDVFIASNGQEAFELLNSPQRFDLVFMDCQMPVMDGFESTSAIRAMSGPTAKIPIVALTASAMSGDRERCLEAGMNDYISKPISLLQLQKVLAQWLPA